MGKISLTVNRKPPLRFITNPSLSDLTPQVGDTLTITPGTAGPEENTITVDTLLYNGVDKTGELVGFDWDTTGETVYGTQKSIVARLLSSAANGFQTRISVTLTAKLVDVPDAFVLADWDAADDGANGIDVTLNGLPDNGGLTIIDIEYQVDGGSWISTRGNVDFNIPDTGTVTSLNIRAVNSIGAGGTSDTKSPTIAAGTAENAVTIANGTYLRAPQLAGSSYRSLLFFMSGTQDAGLDARSCLMGIDGVSTAIHSQFSDGAGVMGARVRFEDSGGANVAAGDVPITIGDRFHMLVSVWTDDTNINLRCYMWDTTSGTWSSVLSQTNSTSAGTTLLLSQNEIELFRFASDAKQYWFGKANRMAMWASTTGAAIADVSLSATQDNFTSGGNVIAPTTAQTAYSSADLLFDFNGPASEWEEGTHDGIWASFSKFGPAIENSAGGGSEGVPATITNSEPLIEGSTAVGSVLTISPGEVQGTEPITTVLELYRDGVYVQDIVDGIYTTTATDAETTLTILQRSSNIYNTEDATAESDPFLVDAVVSDTTAPVWSTNRPATAEHDSGNDQIDITSTIIEADSLPVTYYVVVLPDGGTTPSVAQIKAGTDSADGAVCSANWTHGINGTKTTAASSQLTAATYDLCLVATDDAGNNSLVERIEDVVLSGATTALAFESLVTIANTDPPPVSTGNFTFTLEGQTGPTGDVIKFVSSENDITEGWKPAYYEWRIDNGDGTFTEGRSINAEVGIPLYFQAVNANAGNDVQMRQVDKKLTTIYLNELSGTWPSTYDVSVSDTLYNDTGDSCTVDDIIYWDPDNSGKSLGYGIKKLVVSNVVGEWAREENLYIDDGAGGRQLVGKQGKQEVLPAYNPPETEISEGAWSTVETITPTIGTATFTVTTRDGRSTYTEGESIALEVEPKGFRAALDPAGRMHPLLDLNFRWFVDKAGEESTFEHLDADFPYGRDQTEYYGPQWSYRPKTTGSVTINCEVWSNDNYDNRSTSSVTVTITPKSTKFTAGNTFVVDPDELGTGGPTTSNPIYTTLAAASTAIRSGGAGATRRLSLRNGYTYSETDLDLGALDTVCVDTYGSGPSGGPAVVERATFTGGVMFRFGGCSNAILEGIRVQGPYDAARPDDMEDSSSVGTGVDLNNCTYSTLYDFIVDGMGVNVEMATPGGICNIINGKSTNFGNMSLQAGDAGSYFIFGVHNKQKVNAVRSKDRGDKMAPYTFDHSCGRSSRPTDRYAIGMCDMADLGGWSSNRSTNSLWRHVGAPDENQFLATVMCNRMVMGHWVIATTTSRSFGRPQIMRVEFNHVAVTAGMFNVFNIGLGGITTRNNVFMWEDIPTEFLNGHRAHINISMAGKSGHASETEHAPIVFEYNSMINLKTGSNRDNTWLPFDFSPSSIFPNFLHVIVENNMEHAPAYVDGVDASPLDSTAEWSPYYQGGYFWDGSILNVDSGSGTNPPGNSNVTVTGGTSGASGAIRYRNKPSGGFGDWGAGTGKAELILNATTTGIFSAGESLTFSNGATASAVSYVEGLYDNVAPFPSAHTAASCSWYQPQSGSLALTQGLDTSAGRDVPYFDARLQVRRRDGTTARGAVES